MVMPSDFMPKNENGGQSSVLLVFLFGLLDFVALGIILFIAYKVLAWSTWVWLNWVIYLIVACTAIPMAILGIMLLFLGIGGFLEYIFETVPNNIKKMLSDKK